MNITKQADLAKLFGRSTSWVCKHQTRAVDPMPRDLEGAMAWGKRTALLPSAEPAVAAATTAPAAVPVNNLELQDMALKKARTKKLELEFDLQAEQLLSRDEVEAREVQNAAEFRMIAREYPLRARATIERFVTDAAVVESIMDALKPLAAELLNKADPAQVLKGKSKEEIQAILMQQIEKRLQWI